MIRCPRCGARNYAIDMWCSRCSHHLDWAPTRRRPNRLISFLAPVAAASGVLIAMAMPASSWLAGAAPTLEITLPGTAGGTASPAAETAPAPAVQPASTAQPAATAGPTPTADSVPQSDAMPTPEAAAQPVSQMQDQALAPNPGGDPAAVVRHFYAAISAHQFDVAASLWSAPMQAQYPPTLFIDERFSATQEVDLTAERVVADGGGTAIVSVQVVELTGGETRHWAGTWELIDTSLGWLLNSSNLQAED
jgi:hypothetical protein